MNPEFSSVADDFFVNMNLQTTLALPGGRETVLHFCETVQKQFPSMTAFYQRDSGEFVLEGNREAGSYPWMEIHSHRLAAGRFNPDETADAYRLHDWLLERSVYFLGVSGLDVDCLDVLYGFNLDYEGNRDAIVARALLSGSPLGALAADGPARTIECEPNFVIALDEECYLQARLSLETRGSSFQVRTGAFEDEPISVYFTVRRYPRPGTTFNLRESFSRQCEICEDLVRRIVVPQIIEPLASAIATE